MLKLKKIYDLKYNELESPFLDKIGDLIYFEEDNRVEVTFVNGDSFNLIVESFEEMCGGCWAYTKDKRYRFDNISYGTCVCGFVGELYFDKEDQEYYCAICKSKI